MPVARPRAGALHAVDRVARRGLARRAAVAVLLAAAARPATAQGAEGPPGWRGSAQLDGAVYFGAARQRLVSGTLSGGRSDSALAVRAEVTGAYGDARPLGTDGEPLPWQVTVRNARLTLSADRRPYGRWSPFVFGTVESSLQQRLARRASGGAGAKLTLWRPRTPLRDFAEDASVSAALLSERTRSLDVGGAAAPGGGAGARTRWSLRARVRRRVAAGARISHVTFYQPTVGAPGRYTVESTTILGVPVRARLELTATFRDRFDSEARRRGAPSNHDGQLLFGARLGF